jgi:hypothetical protein
MRKCNLFLEVVSGGSCQLSVVGVVNLLVRSSNFSLVAMKPGPSLRSAGTLGGSAFRVSEQLSVPVPVPVSVSVSVSVPVSVERLSP